jgi:hypothetical protein
MEFLEDLAFPLAVLGPVDLRAFLRFAASCFSVMFFPSEQRAVRLSQYRLRLRPAMLVQLLLDRERR